MPSTLPSRLPLLLLLLVFIACKIPTLHYAYYWDESWPYATAIKYVHDHGISLLPTALDGELSRGHPLFFHALAATWMKIFGDSHIAMHSFALTISLLFLIAIYETALRLFNVRVAFLATFMVAIQEMFFVQSSMVLFDMLVAYLSFVSIVLYVRERYVLAAITLSMLFYTKESGLIAGFIIGCDALWQLFRKEISVRHKLTKLATIGVPCILIGIFFLLQKHLRGWYVFPMYAELAQHKWETIWVEFRYNSIRTQFYTYLNWYHYLLAVAMALSAAVKLKKWWPLTILGPAICIYCFVEPRRSGEGLAGILFFAGFIISYTFFLYTYARFITINLVQRRLLSMLGMFVLCFLIFSSMNFFTGRYLLASIVPMFFIVAVCIEHFCRVTFKWLYYFAIAFIATVTIFAYKLNDNYGDCDLGSHDGLSVQQQVVDYFEQNAPYNTPISTASFLENQHLTDPATGFLHSYRAFSNVKWEINDRTQYVLFDNIEPDDRHDDFAKSNIYHLVKKIEKGRVWAEIYRRR
ncbi:MAG: glycosyltransferase family 39 protein [Bacteroidota bacterium]